MFLCMSLAVISSCDSEESRKNKAETVIKKHLFEILPDYKSYELISLKLDTIKEEWIVAPGMIDLGWEYLTALEEQTEIDADLNRLSNQESTVKRNIAMEFIYGNSNRALIEGGSKLDRINSELGKARKKQNANREQIESIKNQILSKYDSISRDNSFIGWRAINKFRSNNLVGTPEISTRHYYISPDFKTIIISWDEDDETSDTPIMIDKVSQLIKASHNDEIITVR